LVSYTTGGNQLRETDSASIAGGDLVHGLQVVFHLTGSFAGQASFGFGAVALPPSAGDFDIYPR
jgi:hypothetical protein